MSEPVAQMLERLAAWNEAPHQTNPQVAPGMFDEQGAPIYQCYSREDIRRLLALVRAGEALAEEVRRELKGRGDLEGALAAYDEASRGAGQRGEGTNG